MIIRPTHPVVDDPPFLNFGIRYLEPRTSRQYVADFWEGLARICDEEPSGPPEFSLNERRQLRKLLLHDCIFANHVVAQSLQNRPAVLSAARGGPDVFGQRPRPPATAPLFTSLPTVRPELCIARCIVSSISIIYHYREAGRATVARDPCQMKIRCDGRDEMLCAPAPSRN
ncbi:hypothetical protein EVAR_7988_1 [Eumeta japonica]|uniref:Uncharacterized protein n=1 Tax=Eumeta variegata TaxID=151549 RepID=A0A4C1THT4_EUMVA|nr:hypothetical protein EVAR_7988_1 [Eumeta japonica]